jgi:putative RNA 2'-phosphotransferase
MEQRLVAISKFLSYVMRHDPESQGLSMDEHGWVLIEDLLASPGSRKRGITRDVLDHVVAENEKRRYEVDEDGIMIRARQGHSVPVESDWKAVTPPDRLYHGTTSRVVSSIRAEGLLRGTRHHVHLSADAATAKNVGTRHGRPVVLVIRAREMHERGHAFFLSGNGIWLTESVPPEYIDFARQED